MLPKVTNSSIQSLRGFEELNILACKPLFQLIEPLIGFFSHPV